MGVFLGLGCVGFVGLFGEFGLDVISVFGLRVLVCGLGFWVGFWVFLVVGLGGVGFGLGLVGLGLGVALGFLDARLGWCNIGFRWVWCFGVGGVVVFCTVFGFWVCS